MQKQEFEERIERTVTDEQYKVIEERMEGTGEAEIFHGRISGQERG